MNGTLTSGHTLEVEMYHRDPALPSWHPCAKTHAHVYRVDVELAAPRDLVTEEVAAELRVAVAVLGHVDGPLFMVYVDQLEGIDQTNPDSAALAAWVHRWVADRLPDGFGDYLLVRARAGAVDGRPRVHRGSLTSAEGDANRDGHSR